MDLSKMTFVLGGSDTEMITIQSILVERGLNYTYARDIHGDRVKRKDAYDTKTPDLSYNQVWIECRPENWGNTEMLSLGYKLLDHHSQGDPGYNKPARTYWESSSLGQLCTLIDEPRTSRLEMIAAADHCLHQAYNNCCSPIKREEMLKFRLAHYREGLDLAKKRFKETVEFMRRNMTFDFNGTKLVDVSSLRGTNKSFFVTDASAYSNTPFFSLHSRNELGHRKIFMGSIGWKTGEYFLNGGAEEFGKVIKTYGDPSRHFVAAYLELENEG